jgi:hypothetical protein
MICPSPSVNDTSETSITRELTSHTEHSWILPIPSLSNTPKPELRLSRNSGWRICIRLHSLPSSTTFSRCRYSSNNERNSSRICRNNLRRNTDNYSHPGFKPIYSLEPDRIETRRLDLLLLMIPSIDPTAQLLVRPRSRLSPQVPSWEMFQLRLQSYFHLLRPILSAQPSPLTSSQLPPVQAVLSPPSSLADSSATTPLRPGLLRSVLRTSLDLARQYHLRRLPQLLPSNIPAQRLSAMADLLSLPRVLLSGSPVYLPLLRLVSHQLRELSVPPSPPT